MLYKGKRGSFVRVDVYCYLSISLKAELLLLLGWKFIVTFQFSWKERSKLIVPLNFYDEKSSSFVFWTNGRIINIIFEPTHGFAFGFSTLRVISRYFSRNFKFLPNFHNSSTSSIEVEDLFLIWKPYSNISRTQFLLSFMDAWCFNTWTWSWMTICLKCIFESYIFLWASKLYYYLEFV